MESYKDPGLIDSFCGTFRFSISEANFSFSHPVSQFLPILSENDVPLDIFLNHIVEADRAKAFDFFMRKSAAKKASFTMQKIDSDPKNGPFCSVFFSVDSTDGKFFHGTAVNLSVFMPGKLLFKDIEFFIEGISEIRRITHDLNNQFQIISGFGSAIQDEVTDPDMKECATNVMNAVTKAINYNKDLRKYFPPKSNPEIFLPKSFSEALVAPPEEPEKKEVFADSPASKAAVANEKSAKVLVIDDEPLVQKFLCEMLKRLKYTPFGFAMGTEALEFAATSEVKFDLAIIDMNLPDIATEDLFANLLEKDPKLKVILISGDNLGESSQRMLNNGARGYLQKPTTVKKLADTISEVLAN